MKKIEVKNVFGSPQPGQARKNLGIKRNKKLFTDLQTVINQDPKSLTLEVFSSYLKVFPGARVKRSAVQKYNKTKMLVDLQLALLVFMHNHLQSYCVMRKV